MLAFILAGVATPALSATTERLSVVRNGETIGSVVAVSDGRRVSVDYRVDDNGRGPKHREDIVLGPDGIPVSWNIVGTSLMGGPVVERFAWANGTATWTSQADQGSLSAAKPPLYVVNDTSPWANGIYARAALAAGGRSLDVLPGGKLKLARIRSTTIAGVSVTVYRLDGVDLRPSYVMLDKTGRLFAAFGDASVTIRAGLETRAADLMKLAASLESDRVRAISAKVAHRYDGPIRIRNVHIFDPVTGRRGPLSTIVVMRDAISAVLPGDGGPVPDGETAIEGDGGTVYPGLHDMHSHTTIDSGLFYLAAGVTTTRDMGNNNAFLQALLPAVEDGAISSPRIVPTGFIEGRSPYSARNGFVVATLDEGLKAVRWYADRNYFQIKLYNSMNPDLVKPLAEEAKRLGMGVTGHVPAFDSPDRVIRDGYNTIAHINQLMLGWVLDESKEDTRTPLRLTAMTRTPALDLSSGPVRNTIALMKANTVSLDTTAVTLERLMLSRARQVETADIDNLDHLPIGYQRYRKRTFVPLRNAGDDQAYHAAFDKMLDVMRLLHRNGIQLLPGTDDTTGFTLQREVELYTMAGMTPAEALKAATLDCETYLGRADRGGTIARGKLADLVLVAGDPSSNINAIKRPKMVMRGGTVYLPSEIYESLGIRPFASPPTIVPARPDLTNGGVGGSTGALFGWPRDDHDD
ncbi:amidohydrolase family protein [Sphingomonas carotinifaciens]|uniref:Amidohydrolase family protein n=1 Tax=Sphingomonas carotinifaciens TaxID=1166323 RepID=A0A6N8M2P7_9SPHN|nr:amidohydrolase family protein [Sphingomonas carotinifaciens]MWC45662.1 amidohydrolase family protein [Sphingomonas carotinifaciens]